MPKNLRQVQGTGRSPSFLPCWPAHIPCRYESLITYYGVYSSSHRGKCKRENREERIEEIVVETVSVTPGTSRHSSWAKWIWEICGTDPLTCSECREPMRIIAFITDPLEVAKILEHIGEQTSRAPPDVNRSRSLILRLRRHELSIP